MEDEILILIGCIYNTQEKIFREYTGGLGLTGKQTDILMYLLYSEEKCTEQKQLEKIFKVGKSAITTMLNTMERNGFIKRGKTDGRTNNVEPTEKAIELKQVLNDSSKTRNEILFSGISAEEKGKMNTLLKKLYYNVNKGEEKL